MSIYVCLLAHGGDFFLGRSKFTEETLLKVEKHYNPSTPAPTPTDIL
jgi:hypothetical protein